ncbi:hypothetical protein MPL3356_110315 [Mesorhizobium plurifarium]|uniref:Uncharacterized protein n=1 Tax=Mesorhizobium plurifarium TaxID=69974 RepID=A0A090DAB5_MESPL|nr:hypothetical protein MPL3356_110315 [Mesorhizobium plurifarium]
MPSGTEEQASHFEAATALFGRRLVSAAALERLGFSISDPSLGARQPEHGRARLSSIAVRAKALSLIGATGALILPYAVCRPAPSILK